MSMAERTLFATIRDGLAEFTDENDRGKKYERFLTQFMRLDAEEAAKNRIYFAGGTLASGETVGARPPTLVHGFARTGGPLPCWALTLGSEREANSFLGEDGPFLDEDGETWRDPETGNILDPKVRRVEYTFVILVIADHPDITVTYYQLLKYVILKHHQALIDADLDNLALNGADMVPDPRYLPSDVFARQLTVTLQTDEPWFEDLAEYADTVAGIHVDDSGEEATLGEGSVKALITPDTTGS